MTPTDLAAAWLNAAGGHLDGFGMLGMCLGFAAGTMPRRLWILLTSAACSTCFALHFLHLGAFTGAALCSISVLQSLVSALCLGSRARAGLVAPVFVASALVAASLTLATWNGWPSGCAAIGAVFATCARLQADAHAMRLLFLGASLCWAGHNFLVGSAFALTCDLLTISGLAIALLRAGHAQAEPASAESAVPMAEGAR
ncbi:YgjV family protein [Methylobacterium gnaphalii]|uniref:YgjV family protein n=1 Tax=Methylobacterium gnaphalii TaxID=1010610 RepID=A0A512JKD5_9HYPH|nr:YgjV family protein [Methylobacterium gnaphalii]GEP10417.1 hypothetical protein MGN01_22620 [Methylobacterium gnaphalii]GJD71255.1 hypothetical protein MMMDOFMJ_4209 [Methylobacterium gnaphalii]GLS47755.1 hypothetical protein GCM10007885_05990 [Methylobacterium gnaphalii]